MTLFILGMCQQLHLHALTYNVISKFPHTTLWYTLAIHSNKSSVHLLNCEKKLNILAERYFVFQLHK